MMILKKWVICTVLFTAWTFVPAEVYNYPRSARDANDISFYRSVENYKPVANISGVPKKVILCIGDGMSLNEVALARQSAIGLPGRLWMETLPVFGLVRTFSADHAVTDSAAAATAIACGVKTANKVIGMGMDGRAYSSVLEILSDKGWRTGLVATSTITHATPAGFASHVASRASEDVIAEQMLHSGVDVLFGGGRQYWLPKGVNKGTRKDGKDLLAEAGRLGYQVIASRNEMLSLTEGPVLGLFATNALETFPPEPMLADMAKKALSLLNTRNKDWFAGDPKFFIMIEGSQIDWAGHANDSVNSVRQTLLFDMAVKEAIAFARQDRSTLLVVTADHETGGLVMRSADNYNRLLNPKWTTKDHSGADVPVYAFGPGSEKFEGIMDNTEISKKILEAVGIQSFPTVRKNASPAESSSTDGDADESGDS